MGVIFPAFYFSEMKGFFHAFSCFMQHSVLNEKDKAFQLVFVTGIAVMYGLFVSWLTAVVMTIVHDRVPDMNKYPLLPDIILDNMPHVPWAFEMAEMAGMTLLTIWLVMVIFHKHRFIIVRRCFAIGGTIFLLRCFTMLITSLSVPGDSAVENLNHLP